MAPGSNSNKKTAHKSSTGSSSSAGKSQCGRLVWVFSLVIVVIACAAGAYYNDFLFSDINFASSPSSINGEEVKKEGSPVRKASADPRDDVTSPHQRNNNQKHQQQQQQQAGKAAKKAADWIPLTDLLAAAAGIVSAPLAREKEQEKGGMFFYCGMDNLELRSSAAVGGGAVKKEWGTYGDSSSALRRVQSQHRSIPLSRFNDDYCDCDDGSDEPGTSACSYVVDVAITAPAAVDGSLKLRSSTAGESMIETGGEALLGHAPSEPAPSFAGYCAGDPETRLSPRHVNDGVCDCCECTDEESLLLALRDPLQLVGGDEEAYLANFRRRKSLPLVSSCADTISRRHRKREAEFSKALQGHQIMQQRAATGAKYFAPDFIANLTSDRAKLDEETAQYDAMVKALKASGAFRPRVDRETGQPIYDENVIRASQWHQSLQSRTMDLNNRQAVLNSTALGRQFEYFPLYGDCYNISLGPKDLRGGNAEPNGEVATFLVCPFRYIYQLSYEPVEEEENQKPAAAAEGGGGAVHDATATPPSDAASSEGRKEAPSSTPKTKEKYTLVGYWNGFSVSHPLNISSADIPLTGIVNHIHHKKAVMHSYEYGEKCWKGPSRSARVVFACDVEDKILHFYENGMCRYEVVIGTPSACTVEELLRAKAAP